MSELRLKSTGTIKLFENDNSSSVTIASPASLGADRTITLPDADVTLVSGTMLAGTVAIANGGTGATTLAAAGLSNTPAWSAKATADQTGLASGGWTKIQFDTAIFDTDSAYDTTNDKFVVPAGKGGKYFVTASAKINSATSGGTNTLVGSGLRFTVDGANVATNLQFYSTAMFSADGESFTALISLSAAEYVEVYVYYQDNGGGTGDLTGDSGLDTLFSGFKLIG